MRKLSKERQATYYIGNVVSIIGFIVFLSFFFQVVGGFGSSPMPSGFSSHGKPGYSVTIDGEDLVVMDANTPLSPFIPLQRGPNFGTPIIGMILIVSGQFIANIGKSGLAGSGLILDPEQAREDLQPFNVAKGQMLNDTLEEVQAIKNFNASINHRVADQKPSPPLIKVRCNSCKALNDESSKFCSQCGIQLV